MLSLRQITKAIGKLPVSQVQKYGVKITVARLGDRSADIALDRLKFTLAKDRASRADAATDTTTSTHIISTPTSKSPTTTATALRATVSTTPDITPPPTSASNATASSSETSTLTATDTKITLTPTKEVAKSAPNDKGASAKEESKKRSKKEAPADIGNRKQKLDKKRVSIQKVHGIGPVRAKFFIKYGITTAYELAHLQPNSSKFQEIAKELNSLKNLMLLIEKAKSLLSHKV